MEGIQIYPFIDDPFIYLSITSNTSHDYLAGSFEVYTNQSFHNLTRNGFYISAGFGSSVMSNSDIFMCIHDNKSNKQWCEDYESKGWSIFKKDKQSIKLISFKNQTLNELWTPYKTYVSFGFNRTIDEERIEGVMNIGKIISGNEKMLFSYGELTNSVPKKHNNQISGLYSKDGFVKGKNEEGSFFNNKTTKNRTLVYVKNKNPYFNNKNHIKNVIFIWILIIIILNNI
jgi:hypothetical protein